MNVEAVIEAMRATGASDTDILNVIQAGLSGARRSAGAERQARYRARIQQSVTSDVTSDASLDVTPDPLSLDKEKSPTPPKENSTLKPSQKTPKGVQKGPVAGAFEGVLSPEMADAVVAHRKALKAPLQPVGAQRLAKKFAACPDPNEAAATMIERGWQGFEPDWMPKTPTVGKDPPVEAVPRFDTEEEFQAWWRQRRMAAE